MTFSISIAHTPWKPERREALSLMREALTPLPPDAIFFVHDTDYRGKPWNDIKHEWALACWRWHLDAGATHCLMMSDDLTIMPGFWEVMQRMVESVSGAPIGCMSNHPKGPKLLQGGTHWYRTQSWLVGPCIVMPRKLLAEFVQWYEKWYPKLPKGEDSEGHQEFYHDDSSINEWVGKTGRYSYHPLPAPIEHRLELGRTHDVNPFPPEAAEAVSWRRRWLPGREYQALDPVVPMLMQSPEWWRTEAPFLHVTSEERRLGIE